MIEENSLPALRSRLLGWFRQFQRDLPWRRTRDPYRIWLSEIMLQQTRVATVIPYYERFLARFPNVQALAAAPEEEVLRLWSGLGYYSRARNLQKAAREIVAKHGGEFPNDRVEALALPGIGGYTAAAILSIACGAKLAVLDGNVARVLARLGAIRGDVREPKRWKSLQQTADVLLDGESPGDWNQAMMELGATLCTPRSPQCLLCPAGESCKARKLGLAERIPERRKRRTPELVTLAAVVFIDSRGRTLLLPPPHAMKKSATHENVAVLVSRMWHFPTFKVVEKAEAELRKFVARLLRAPARRSISQPEPLKAVRHTVTYRQVTILPFRLRVKSLPRIPGAKILPLEDLLSVPVSNLTRKVAQRAT
jgi:A/G-specific adenine glycosylase